MSRRVVQVLDYDPQWPHQFAHLQGKIWPLVKETALAIEHVGSTAIPGMCAKPVIDLDIVISTRNELPAVIGRLAELNYKHLGNLGIEGREAFSRPENEPVLHNLYVCTSGSAALANHLVLRDHLRTHPQDVLAYSCLKRDLAQRFAQDIDSYVEGKTEFIRNILAKNGVALER